MAALIGKWKYESTNNLDALMDKMGVSDQIKQVVNNSKPVVEISQNGDTWHFVTKMGEHTRDITFKLGEEFDNTTITGQPVKSVIKLEGDCMVENQVYQGHNIQITRKIVDGKLVSTYNLAGETGSMTFTRA